MGGQTRILLGDEHEIFRCGLRHLLTDMVPNADLIGEAADGRELVRLVRELNPTLIIMGLVLPELNGIDALQQIIQEFPAQRVIILTASGDPHYIAEALKRGAKGYLLKDSPVAELLGAISTVLNGKTYLSPAVAELVVQNHVRQVASSDGLTENAFSDLSSRERQVLQLLAEGKTSKEIAARLFISLKTVETHRNQIMTKLQIRSIAGLTRYAIRCGLTSA